MARGGRPKANKVELALGAGGGVLMWVRRRGGAEQGVPSKQI